jgi:nitroreductase
MNTMSAEQTRVSYENARVNLELSWRFYQMSEVINNMKTRRSIRKYKPDMIPEDVLNRIIEAGTYAATGMGKQSPIIIAVTNKEIRDKFSKMNAEIMGVDSDPFYGAPVVLIVLADKARPTYVYDGSLVMGNLMLAAHAEGIGSCWIHRAKEEFESAEGKAFLKSLGIEGEYEGIGHCVLGYTDGEEPKAMPRKENYVYCVK